MCLAIPSRIEEIVNNVATVDVGGLKRKASLLLLENAEVGDYVIVHAGFAIHRIEESEAMETLAILREAVDRTEQED
ncbi:MAG: HypC/HybG/HupF family hydrogenase formation chaperone [Deltaproteobacteria bacterium]|nr:HypC/HybG/HupF family hydrogenase formation chaperone [Deltaproteobacteria bacterium]